MIYPDDDRMLAACMASLCPKTVSVKLYDIHGPDGLGQYQAAVIQETHTGVTVERDLLASRFFGTLAGAQRWLNRQRRQT